MKTAASPKPPLVASHSSSFIPSDISNNNSDSSKSDRSDVRGPIQNTLTVSSNNNNIAASSSASPSTSAPPSSSLASTAGAASANASLNPMLQATSGLPAASIAMTSGASTPGSSTTVKPLNPTSATGKGGGGGGGGRTVRCGVGCLTKSATQPSLTNSPPTLVSKPSVASLCSLQGEEPLAAGALRSVACGSVVSFTTASPGRSVEDVTAEASDYTDAKSTLSAPVELLSEQFLSAVMTRDYETALKLCQSILKYEPSNTTAREFYPLILTKLQQLSVKKDTPNTSTDEGNESDDGTMDSYSSLDDDEDEDEDDDEDEDEEEEKEEEERDDKEKTKSVAANTKGKEGGATATTRRDVNEVASVTRKPRGLSKPNQNRTKDPKLAAARSVKHHSPVANTSEETAHDGPNSVSTSDAATTATATTTVRSTKSHNDCLDQAGADKDGPAAAVSETVLSASGSSDLSSSGMATGSADSLISSTESDLTLGSRHCHT